MRNPLQWAGAVLLLAMVYPVVQIGRALPVTFGKLNALLDTSQKTVLQARVTLDEINKTTLDERHYFERDLPVTLGRVNRSIDSFNGLLVSTRGTAEQATQTLAETTQDAHHLTQEASVLAIRASDTIQGFQNVQNAATQSLFALNRKIENPDIQAIIHHLDGISASTDEIAADSASKLHDWVHPTKKKLTFWAATEAGLLWFHNYVLPPISLW